jgi:hypothetical protein
MFLTNRFKQMQQLSKNLQSGRPFASAGTAARVAIMANLLSHHGPFATGPLPDVSTYGRAIGDPVEPQRIKHPGCFRHLP